MSFRWDYEDAEGGPRGGSGVFASRNEAEDFIGHEWRQLLESGIQAVVLTRGDDAIYRMKLTAE